MSARLLTHLRHVDLAVPDYDKQLDFYAGVWGLTKVAEDSGISFLAAEGSPEQYSSGCARPARSASTSCRTGPPAPPTSTPSPNNSSPETCG
jgi:catechol 2,3-dioxygenase-like lactoylglutathione lyase family enzyme